MGKRGPEPGTGGRPKIEIDWKVFETACKLCATREDICSLLGSDDNTLDRRIKEKYKKTFGEVLKELGELTKLSLRRNQFKMSENNPTMAIWLGKQYLDQRDKADVDHTTKGDKIKSIAPHCWVGDDDD